MKANVEESLITITLNGIQWPIKTKSINGIVYYNLYHLCKFLGYKYARNALLRLYNHNLISDCKSIEKAEYVDETVLLHLIEKSPCHYSQKIKSLFLDKIINWVKNPEEYASVIDKINAIKEKYSKLEVEAYEYSRDQDKIEKTLSKLDKVLTYVDDDEQIKKQLIDIKALLKQKENELDYKRDFKMAEMYTYYNENNVKDCLKYDSEYESDYEETEEEESESEESESENSENMSDSYINESEENESE